MKESVELGRNRTGMGTAPRQSRKQDEHAWQAVPAQPGDIAELAQLRAAYNAAAEPVGSVPPPPGVKGAVKAALHMGKGRNPAAFLDRLGERLAFERTGTRLYELLINKFESRDSHTGPASADLLSLFRDQELRHFRDLWDSLERLGADPTAQTPSADLAGVKGSGIIQLIADPRTTFVQSLDAILIAELADNEGWRLLIAMAEGLEKDEMAEVFRVALHDEEIHLEKVREWWTELMLEEAGIEIAALRHS